MATKKVPGRVLCHPSPSSFVEMNASSHRFNKFSEPCRKVILRVARFPLSPLCFASFLLSSFSFISSYIAYITELQLIQLWGNRRAEKQKETGPSVCLSVTRKHLQQTLNSSNMANVGHGKQKPSRMMCGLRSFCHRLASCSCVFSMCEKLVPVAA